MDQPQPWSVAQVRCTDAFDRAASIHVTVRRRGRVTVTTPAGEAGILQPSEVRELIAALQDALSSAEMLRPSRSESHAD